MNKIKDTFSSFRDVIKTTTYFVRLSLQYDKWYLLYFIPLTILNSISPFIDVFFTKIIIDAVVQSDSFDTLSRVLIEMLVLKLIIGILSKLFSHGCNKKIIDIRAQMRLDINEKSMLVKYEYLEDPTYLDMKSRASQCIDNNYDIAGIANNVSSFITNIITLLGLAYLISQLNLLMVLLIIFVVVINSYAKAKQARKTHFFRSQFSKIARKLFYIIGVTWDYKYAKEIKTYNLKSWLSDKKQNYLKETSSNSNKIFFLSTLISLLSVLTSAVQQLVVYLYLVINVLNQTITIGEFSMYVTAINRFSISLTNIMGAYIAIAESSLYLADYISFLELETSYQMHQIDEEIPTDQVEIEFCNVSFAYPGQEKLALEDVSVRISKNEKLAIVGENGAGKSTFVKLIMRLYTPTKGKILLNGIDIQTIELSTYTKLISSVFQDYKALAFSVKENISIDDNFSEKRMKDTLTEVGLIRKIDGLQHGIETNMSKEFDMEGIEFSGGEQQKVALAQAIYKDAPIVILDEPTSNLSPIAEFELYKSFNDMVQDKMAIFISHRLSSCRFCDSIVVLDKGKIVEYGGHDALLKQGGMYFDMFYAQSEYYSKLAKT